MNPNPFDSTNPVYIIAEAGSNWRMGTQKRDLSMAYALIDAAAEAGADAVKFQTYKPETVYVQNAGSSNYLSKSGNKEDILDIFRDLSMPYEMIPELSEYCKKNKIDFMSTPFSVDDFDAIDPFVKIHKIASYEISHLHLIKKAAISGKPLVLSTGASEHADIQWAVDTFRSFGGKSLCLLQCTAKYPAPISSLNLHVVSLLEYRYKTASGLSDHSRDPSIGPITAVALGARVIEKHFTLHNKLPGPDHSFAITPTELTKMVRDIRMTESALGMRIKCVTPDELELSAFARRGLQAIKDIKVGDRLCEDENFAILRPGKQLQGLHPRHLQEIEGKIATRDIPLGQGIRLDDIKP
jgi:sialic acid synthase SpsE